MRRFLFLDLFFLKFISVRSSTYTIHHECAIWFLCCFQLLLWHISWFFILDQDLVFSLYSFLNYFLFHDRLTLSELLDHALLFVYDSIFFEVLTTQFLALLFFIFILFSILIFIMCEACESFWSFGFNLLSDCMNLSIFCVHVWIDVVLWQILFDLLIKSLKCSQPDVAIEFRESKQVKTSTFQVNCEPIFPLFTWPGRVNL